MTHIISGLSEIEQDYDGFIFDIYGVLHDGETIFPETKKVMRSLMEQGKKICLVSNTPKRSWQSKRDLKQSFDIDEDLYTDVVTGGESAFVALQDHKGQTCWFAGDPEFARIAEDTDLVLIKQPQGADFILNAISGHNSDDEKEIYDDLDKALELKLPMICSNPDMIVNIGQEQFECGGTFAKYYEDHGGEVSYHGKPHPHVYNMALDVMGLSDKSKVLGVGDSLHTDIQGANNFGINSVWNLHGIHWEEIADDFEADKADRAKIRGLLNNSKHAPDFLLIDGFRW